MNYNRNEKIMQIQEDTLIIGIDIAKRTNYARAQDARGLDLAKALKFDNCYAGFLALLQWIQDLKESFAKTNVIVGMEPTGHYWLPLAYMLKDHDLPVVAVNPMHVNRSKELDDNSPSKNDVKDAKVIAQLVKDGRYSAPNLPEGVYAELRQGMNIHESLTKRLNMVKAKTINWLERYFPEFTDVFKDWEGKAALQVLQLNKLPHELAGMNDDTILTEVKKHVSRGVGPKRMRALKEAAQKSIGIRTGSRMAKRELNLLLKEYHQLTQELHDLEDELTELIQPIPGAKQMLEMKGLGLITVAGFFSEVGDLRNYEHPRQLIKLAGLNLRRNESGKHKGQTRISKRGRRKLRALLFRVALPLASRNPAFQKLHVYYRNRADNPLTGKQSLVALCCKLLKILFVMGKRQCDFDEERMIHDIPHFQDMQEAV